MGDYKYKIATIHVSGAEARAVDLKPIPRGITGAVVEIVYDDTLWAGLNKKVAFEGNTTVEKLCDDSIVPFPAEVATKKNARIRVGITGVDADEVLVIPTLWADLGAVQDSAYGNYPAVGEPVPPIWAQIQAKIGDVEKLTTEDRANLVAAINEVYGKVGDNADLAAKLDEALADISDLKKFHPIAISSVSNNVGTVELGVSIGSVTVTWVLNKAPVSQAVAGEAVDAADRSAVVTGPFTSGRSFAVTATDAEGNTASKSTSISFVNGVYYGALNVAAALNSAAVLGLSRKLQSGRGVTFTATPGAGQRPVYACPARYGVPKFVIGGFEYTWNKIATIDFTNASGYTEKYDIWMHGQDVSDSMTITVS